MTTAGGPGRMPAGLPAPAEGWFTTRAGGHSAGPFAEGNLALHVGDDPEAVRANREHLARSAGASRLFFAEQVHGCRVAVLAGTGPLPEPAPGGLPGVDALVTDAPGAALVVLAADCLPVLLADPVAGVVAAAHAGRRGLVGGILQETLAAMAGLGAAAERTVAVVGPAVCGSCYELPEELAEQTHAALPASRARTREGRPAADLPAGALAVLRAAGVADARQAGGCTREQPERFYSYRGEGRTGRHAGVVRILAGARP